MFDYELLDPGIRDLVRRLHAAGFTTVDSGDGVTKFRDGTNCPSASRYPNVRCVTTKDQLLAETDRLLTLLPDGWTVQALYHPDWPETSQCAIYAADYSAMVRAQLEKEAVCQ